MNNLENLVSPDHAQLENDYFLLKSQYINYLIEKEVLLEFRKPLLEARYNVKLGQRKYELLQQQLKLKQLKRQVDLCVLQVNLNQTIEWNKIKILMKSEFKAEHEQIFQEMENIAKANHIINHAEFNGNILEIRKLYRLLAKILHPDFNPAISREQVAIWFAVKEAYKNQDLDALLSLEMIARDFTKNEIILSNDFLRSKIDLMKTGIQKLILEIQQITQQFPFTIEKLLNDEKWIADQFKEIALQIKRIDSDQTIYLERLELLKSL